MLTYEEHLSHDVDWALKEGSMHFGDESAVHKTLRKLAQRLEQEGVSYALAGGMALFLHIVARRRGQALQHLTKSLKRRSQILPRAEP